MNYSNLSEYSKLILDTQINLLNRNEIGILKGQEVVITVKVIELGVFTDSTPDKTLATDKQTDLAGLNVLCYNNPAIFIQRISFYPIH